MHRRTTQGHDGHAAAHESAALTAENGGNLLRHRSCCSVGIMEAIDVPTDEPQPGSRSPYRVSDPPGNTRSPAPTRETDPAMIFATITLLAASLVRLVPPLSGQEAFGVETTLALGAALTCAGLALREGLLCVRDRLAVGRGAATVRSTTSE